MKWLQSVCLAGMILAGFESIGQEVLAGNPVREVVIFEQDFRGQPLPAGWRTEPSDRTVNVSPGAEGLTLTVSGAESGKLYYFRSPALAFPAPDGHTVRRRFRLEARASVQRGGEAFLRILAGGGGKAPVWVTQTPDGQNQMSGLPLAGDGENPVCSADYLPDAAELRLYLELRPADGTGVVTLKSLRFVLEEEIAHAVETGFPGNVVSAETGIVTVTPLPGTLSRGRILLRDEAGRVLREHKLSLSGAPERLTLERGYYDVEVDAIYADGRRVRTSTGAAVVGKPLDEAVRRRSPYGLMTVHLPEELAVAAGGNWDWKFFYPSVFQLNADGKMTPRPLPPSRLSRHYAMNGPLPVITAGKTAGEGLWLPVDLELYRKLMREWAAANASGCDLLSVYNEPDGHWRGSAEELVTFHKVTAEAIREGSPGTKVYGPVLSSLNAANRRRLVEWSELGLLDALDGLTLHAYVDGSAPEGEFLENILGVREFLRTRGRQNMPIHLTEFGWTTHAGTWQKPVSELEQARYAARSLALISTCAVDSAIYFCGRYNLSRSTRPGEEGFSVCRRDNTPRPAYAALAQSMKFLAALGTRGEHLQPAPGEHLVLHRTADDTRMIAWTEYGTVRREQLPGIQEIRDITGRKLPVEKSLELSPSPIYLVSALRFTEPSRIVGSSVVTHGDELFFPGAETFRFPEGIRSVNGRLRVDERMLPGEYLGFRPAGTHLELYRLQVEMPLSIREIRATVDPAGGGFLLRGRIFCPTPVTQVRAVWESGSLRNTLSIAQLPAGESQLELPLDGMPFGRRLTGRLNVSARCGSHAVTAEQIHDLLLLPVYRAESAEQLAGMPAIRLEDWPVLGSGGPPGTFRLGWNERALLLLCEVEDPGHYADRDALLWRGDSLQFALDVDAAAPWQPNVARNFNGHRVQEFGAALNSAGIAQLWRWLAYAPGKTPGGLSPREGKVLVVRRDGRTIYRLELPWDSAGVSGAPRAGTEWGFAAVINDTNRSGERRGRLLAGGIADGKDPRVYGRIFFLP